MATSNTFSPLAHRQFALILVGSLLANCGNAIQAVGAAWHLTASGAPADLIALVQTATNLPIMLLALPAGAWADMFDKRRVAMAAQLVMLLLALALAATVSLGAGTPTAIIGMTALLACGIACLGPALASSVGGIVPRAELAAAVALNILAFNVARSLGPAIGGAIVAAGGAGTAFVVSAVLYVLALAVFRIWRGVSVAPSPAPRGFGGAIAEGVRYSLRTPQIRTIMIRAITFSTTGAAAWALMPLVSAEILGRGSAVYGLLLGALGLGAVVGAGSSTWFRQRFSSEAMIRAAGIVYGASCIAVALSPNLLAMLALLVLAGAGWVQALSGFSVAGQIWSPREVVGRVMAMVSSFTFGGIALGSWLWGHFAESHGAAAALIVSGGLMIILPVIGLLLPMPAHQPPQAAD